MKKVKPLRFQRARQPHQIDLRNEEILCAALGLFQQKGLENVTLTDIGIAANTAKSNLYRYFQSREHIYLKLLQQLAAGWEKTMTASLQAIEGRSTLNKVAEAITDAFIRSEQYSVLITVINSVLEKKLEPELVVDFRSAFLERRKRFASNLTKVLPNATYEKIFPLTLHIFTHVAGLWPLCHPSLNSKKMLAQPEFAHLNLDFKTEMTKFLQLLLGSY